MDDDMMDDFEEEFETITMIDDETGEEMEFAIIDAAEYKDNRYILVVESELIDDDEAEAMIFKEISDKDDEITYEVLDDDEEFDKIAEIFQSDNDDYEVKL